MDNPNISEESREKLEEAAAFVIMEQYAKALDAGINKKMEDCAEEDFPEELDKRCRGLIDREFAKSKQKQRRKSALRVLRSAAVVALVMLSLCSVLFVSVDAFRIPVMNFFIEKTDRYQQLSAKNNEDWVFVNFNEKNPLEGIISYDYTLISASGTLENGNLFAEYSNNNKSSILFYVNRSTGKLQIDDENAVFSECKVAGHNAKLYEEGVAVRLVWLDENIARTCYLYATKVSKEAVVSFAEEIANSFD